MPPPLETSVKQKWTETAKNWGLLWQKLLDRTRNGTWLRYSYDTDPETITVIIYFVKFKKKKKM